MLDTPVLAFKGCFSVAGPGFLERGSYMNV